MDEIKKWDLQQLPGYKAIEEEPEDFFDTKEVQKDEESIAYKISNKDLNKILNDDIYPDDDRIVYMNKMDLEKIIRENDFINKNNMKLLLIQIQAK